MHAQYPARPLSLSFLCVRAYGESESERNLGAAFGPWLRAVLQKLSLSSISHTQKGPRDASEAVLAGGPLRVHEAATRVRDLEWPS